MKKLTTIVGIVVSFLLLCGIAEARRNRVPTKAAMRVETGVASYYTTDEGYQTASGRRLNDNALTAAHKSLPFGTKVRVTNLKNGKSVVVVITDRGPYVGGRPIDLTKAGFRQIASISQGLVRVKVEPLPIIEQSDTQLEDLLIKYISQTELAYISFHKQLHITSIREVHPLEFD